MNRETGPPENLVFFCLGMISSACSPAYDTQILWEANFKLTIQTTKREKLDTIKHSPVPFLNIFRYHGLKYAYFRSDFRSWPVIGFC